MQEQEVIALCNHAKTFPQNFNGQNSSSSSNSSLYDQLNIHAERLFSDEDESTLDFLELRSRRKGAQPLCNPIV